MTLKAWTANDHKTLPLLYTLKGTFKDGEKAQGGAEIRHRGNILGIQRGYPEIGFKKERAALVREREKGNEKGAEVRA